MRRAPMILTAGNALLGIAAMVLIVHGHYQLAMFAILLGAVFDGMDGWAARRFGVASTIGASADMISDMISFGIAPALIVAQAGSSHWSVVGGILYLLAIVYRLVRFRFGPSIQRGFVGMPSPASALALIAAVVLVASKPETAPFTIIPALVFSGLAVSRLPFPKWGNPALHLLSKPVWYAILAFHLVLFIFWPAQALLLLMVVYTFLGPALMFRYRAKQSAMSGAGVP